ncbi:TetR/AcrR family transcriptional regulator [Dickeya dianthicola]|uniref:TetR/AcrR family transcriptional regulator n=1 Tax=Dickeya dianthicola TaxID=204039 RepID=A0AAX1C7U8_9GAMM|nr:TetR/AcrR family transcriptional regulator [Dickeya dianthicola]MCA7002935.1 TetR/AcrR family transcriptional regulator [Dickeya dianthicola]MCI4003466.1 TetR/AcrR family transcriptional regulator [Dickeya dianthicola]MCI4154111.1 TetR/AcrR family transcriptional regulator [Dickeya dianthicola]MCI4177868.1 TetR/AcrR family transcriptional regulator [Dickeya dianthicola]MCI4195710.1 TetR/AcrR family transcriptional regulator [Dickeya dianthicola]
MVQNKKQGGPRPRGRPRKFNEAEVVERARDVFWNYGYAASSLDDLAAATGLNRPSLYAAFGDKHALYLRALEENRVWSVEGIRLRMTGTKPLRELLRDFLIEAAESTLAGAMGARGCFIVCTAVTESLRDPETRAIAAGYVADVDRAFRERFERSKDELNVGVDPSSASAVASAMLQTLAVRARTGSGREELVSIVDAAVIAICGQAGGGVRS